MRFQKLLSGDDLRSIGKSNIIVSKIENQLDFDDLFKCLFVDDRIVIARAVDAIEKITAKNLSYLQKHKNEVLKLCDTVTDKEMKWHLAQLVPRLSLSKKEFGQSWKMLTNWAFDKTNSRIVRVNSIQGLSELLKMENNRKQDLERTLQKLKNENIPSLNARIKLISQQLKLRQ